MELQQELEAVQDDLRSKQALLETASSTAAQLAAQLQTAQDEVQVAGEKLREEALRADGLAEALAKAQEEQVLLIHTSHGCTCYDE